MSSDDLKSFIESFSGDRHLAVEENLGDGFVRLKTAEAERRQAKHDIRCVEDIVIEMLRNARDAHAHTIYIATSRNDAEKTLVLIDDGDGVPEGMRSLIFEPRVTSKLETMVMDTWGVHGRGMALYSIKTNVDSIDVIASVPGQGTAFVVRIDLDLLPEKTDQSSLPVLEKNEEGEFVVASGPHNILRTVVEFSLEARGQTNVFIGSPAEIAATLIETGRSELTDSGLLFCDDLERIPLLLRPAAASDASELVRACADLGLEMSERTAHRVLVGDIAPVPALLDTLIPKASHDAQTHAPDIFKDKRGLKISTEDLRAFAHSLENAFDELAEKYYIELADAPVVRVSKDIITVKFPFEKEL